MKQLIAVRQSDTGKYEARALNFSHISSVADSEEQAVEQVRRSLSDWLRTARFVSIEVSTDPLHGLAGKSKNDPDFQLYLEEIERYRQEVEAKECSSSS